MGLPELAHQIAAQGRGNDRMLVHMEPQELQGLQALAQKHGGSLTINPQTGLPEAGFLSSFLPMAIGAAADVMSGGALTPMEMALVAGGTGAADYAMTGSLKQGLMAGVGAYGGAGLAGGVMGAGSAADLASTAPDAGVSGWGSAVTDSMGMSPGSASSLGAGVDPTLGGTSNMAGAGSGAAGTSGMAGSPSGATVTPGTTPSTIAGTNAVNSATTQAGSSNLDTLKAGFNSITNSGSNAMDFAKNNWKYGLAAAAPGLSSMASSSSMPGVGPATIRPYSFNQTPNPKFGQPGQPYFINQGYTAGTPYNYTGALSGPGSFIGNNSTPGAGAVGVPAVTAASGGIMGLDSGGAVPANAVDPQTQQYYNALMGSTMQSNQNAAWAMGAPQGYAHGGLGGINQLRQDPLRTLRREMIPTTKIAGGGALGDYSDGGHLLSGPGDGVSDDIPASINGKQPARLASGEFVVPARIVSEIGNGSTEAGAKRLYSMMDRVQNARKKSIGKGKFAEDSEADKHLPA
jgi:hypothetical protein